MLTCLPTYPGGTPEDLLADLEAVDGGEFSAEVEAEVGAAAAVEAQAQLAKDAAASKSAALEQQRQEHAAELCADVNEARVADWVSRSHGRKARFFQYVQSETRHNLTLQARTQSKLSVQARDTSFVFIENAFRRSVVLLRITRSPSRR